MCVPSCVYNCIHVEIRGKLEGDGSQHPQYGVWEQAPQKKKGPFCWAFLLVLKYAVCTLYSVLKINFGFCFKTILNI